MIAKYVLADRVMVSPAAGDPSGFLATPYRKKILFAAQNI